MLCFKLLTLFAIVLCLIPEQSQVSATFWLKKCFYKHCSNYENTVYASDGNNCLVFRNSCHVKNEICRRRRENKPQMSLVTKNVCQANCVQDCSAEPKAPVCGEYAGLYTPFDNECELLKAACVNGQPIIKVRNSACPAQG